MHVTHRPAPLLSLDHRFAALEGFSVPCRPARSPTPQWLRFNRPLAQALGLDADALDSDAGLALFCGNALPEGAQPVAQAYAGHQFGGFSPQLGDGRALLLGELTDPRGRYHDVALKGSGRTPFSRGGDGKAALGPVLREYLVSEAMHALGIPTTRALAAVTTGETVYRDRPLPGAVLTRVAASHVRVGSFQFFASRGDTERVRQLAEHVIERHYPDLKGQEDRMLELLRAVAERQASLIARWMGVGFVHGVMNTDNMTVSGETIDYGPCAFMDAFNPATVFSSIDTRGRYAYDQQPTIAQWNLTRLAEALLPLIDADEDLAVARATEVLQAFPERFAAHWLTQMRAKLGLSDTGADYAEADRALANGYLAVLERHAVDFTLAFRRLSDALRGDTQGLMGLFGAGADDFAQWLTRWQERLGHPGAASAAELAQRMDAVNPIYIPRNHRVEQVIAAAIDEHDLAPFEVLLETVIQPFDEHPDRARFAQPATTDESRGFRTFCGT